MDGKTMNNDVVVFAEERQKQILCILEEYGKVTVKEICELFNVSPVTVRADLRDLEARRLLKRTHGGAIPVSKTAMEDGVKLRERINHKEKLAIARKACEFINDGDSIILDSGTTTLELARLLQDKKNLTVLTNDLRIANLFESMDVSFNVIIAGGTMRHGYGCTVGPITLEVLKGLQVDKAFISTNSYAFGEMGGFGTPDLNQAQVKKRFIKIASHVMLLMDSSKLGERSFSTFATLQDIDMLIVDDAVDEDFFAEMEKFGQGVQVVLA